MYTCVKWSLSFKSSGSASIYIERCLILVGFTRGGREERGTSLWCDVAIGPVAFFIRVSKPLSLPLSSVGERGETSNTQRRTRRAPPVNDAHHSYLCSLRMPFCRACRSSSSRFLLLHSQHPATSSVHLAAGPGSPKLGPGDVWVCSCALLFSSLYLNDGRKVWLRRRWHLLRGVGGWQSPRTRHLHRTQGPGRVRRVLVARLWDSRRVHLAQREHVQGLLVSGEATWARRGK